MPVRFTIIVAALVALLITGLGLGLAWVTFQPPGPPLVEARFSHATVTPNADGREDVAVISYRLRRPAAVSIYFEDAQKTRYYFRRDKAREAGEHTVAFSGVVEPYRRPDEQFAGDLLARVLADGAYTWVVEARQADGLTQAITGTLGIAGADVALPLLNLTVSPRQFTPNQDGLTDRVVINVGLEKDVSEGGLRVFLVGPNGALLSIPERPGQVQLGRRGLHSFDYDGGIDQGFVPPPDGEYLVRAEAEDRLGQRMAVTTPLTIANGGLPRASILLGEVEWSDDVLLKGETLAFTLTVENYGTAPIRTSGPPSGWVYDSMSTNHNTIEQYVQAGVFRVGVNCETCESDYPWRWALGTPDELTLIPDEQGRPQYYLMPGQRVTVRGGVVLDRIVPSRNPQYFWAGLIHEEVNVVNQNVAPAFVEILER